MLGATFRIWVVESFMFFWGEVGIQHVLASDFRFQIWTNQFTPGVPGVLLKHIG